MRGHEEGRLLSDASLFPLYKEAERLDLPICIHAGTGDFGYYHQYGQDVFSRFKLRPATVLASFASGVRKHEFVRVRFAKDEIAKKEVVHEREV